MSPESKETKTWAKDMSMVSPEFPEFPRIPTRVLDSDDNTARSTIVSY